MRFSGKTSGLALLPGTILCAIWSSAMAEPPIDRCRDVRGAVKGAAPGDTIFLGRLACEELDLSNIRNARTVTLASSDPSALAQFRLVDLSNAQHLALENIRVVAGEVPDPSRTYAISVLDSSQIVLRGLKIASADDGVRGNDAIGVFVRNSEDIFIEDSTFTALYSGIMMLDSARISVSGNLIQRMGVDGIAGGGLRSLKVAGNRIGDFETIDPVKHHPDAIQLWDRGTSQPNADITITGNAILRGDGDGAQGIFLKSPGIQASDILIEDNIVHQSFGQGIFVENARNVRVQNNTIAPYDWTTDRPGIDIRAPGEIVGISGNFASALRLPPEVESERNVVLNYENPWADHYAEQSLRAAYTKAAAHPQDFTSLVRGVGAPHAPMAFGSPEPRPQLEAGRARPLASMIVDLIFENGLILDAAEDPISFTGAPPAFGREAGVAFASFDGRAAADGGYLRGAPVPKASAALDLSIAARIRRNRSSTDREMLAIVPNSWQVRFSGDRIEAIFFKADGAVERLKSAGVRVGDGVWHDVEVRYSGSQGRLEISINGKVIAQSRIAPGPIAYQPKQPLMIGGAPWSNTFSGDIARLPVTR